MAFSDDFIMIPTLQVREGCVLMFNVQDRYNRRRITDIDRVRRMAYSSVVTKGAQKRISSALDIFMQTTENRYLYNTVTQKHMNFRMGFATLTISDECKWSADVCYTNLLKPFLRIMKEKHGVRKYIWKYEYQKRGNVHYHVTWDEFVAYDKIRNAWNKIQHTHHLTDKYALRHGHFNPNSTDIHKVWHIENIQAYLGKYLRKEGGAGANDKGKVWDCSVDLKRKRFSSEFVWENNDRLEELIGRKEASVIHGENCTIVKCKQPEKLLTENQQIDYCIWKYK